MSMFQIVSNYEYVYVSWKVYQGIFQEAKSFKANRYYF